MKYFALAACCSASIVSAQPVGRIDQHVPLDPTFTDLKVATLCANGDVVSAIVRWNSGAPDEPGGIYLTRITPVGTFAWSRYLEPVAPEQNFMAYQTGVTSCANDDLLLSGFINMSPGYYRHFLLRVDGNGELLWSRSFDFFADLGDEEGADDLHEFPDGTIGWMARFSPSVVMRLQSDGTLISARSYTRDGAGLLGRPAWDPDGGAFFTADFASVPHGLFHMSAAGTVDWARQAVDVSSLGGAQRAQNGDYLIACGQEERPAIMRMGVDGEVLWATAYTSGTSDPWLGIAGIQTLTDIVPATGDEYLANHYITSTDTNLVFFRVSGSGVPLTCRKLVSNSHAYEMLLLGVAQERAVLAGGEWLTGTGALVAYPVWRVPLSDPQQDPCGMEVQAVAHTAFVPAFDTLTVTPNYVPVSSYELPLTSASVVMTTSDPCSPVGIEQLHRARPYAWPVPVAVGGSVRVSGISAMDVLALFGADGRQWPLRISAREGGLELCTTDLAPGIYSLRVRNAPAVRIVLR